jgi:hypothetical protein
MILVKPLKMYPCRTPAIGLCLNGETAARGAAEKRKVMRLIDARARKLMQGVVSN